MFASIISGFTLGLSVGGYCFLTCGVTLAGLMTAPSDEPKKFPVSRFLLYFLGRLVVYALLAVLFAFLSVHLEHWLRFLKQPLYLLTGLYLAVLGGGGNGPCLASKPYSAFWLGVLNAVQPCPPFFSLIAAGLAAGSVPNTIILFLSFYTASSIVLLPALIPGLFRNLTIVRSIGRLTLAAAAAFFLFTGLFGLAHTAGFAYPEAGVRAYYFKYAAVALVIVLAILSLVLNNKILKTVTRIYSVLVLGVIAGVWLSINELTGVLHAAEIFAYLSPLLVLLGAAFIGLFYGGRYFCDLVCPFGCASELGHQLLKAVKVPAVDSGIRWLGIVKYLLLAVFLALFFPSGKEFGFEPFRHLLRPVIPSIAFFVSLGLLAVSIFDRRWYCKYLCVLNAVFLPLQRFKEKLSEKFALRKIRP